MRDRPGPLRVRRSATFCAEVKFFGRFEDAKSSLVGIFLQSSTSCRWSRRKLHGFAPFSRPAIFQTSLQRERVALPE